MQPCHYVEITTPKKYILNGLWWGPRKPKRVVIWIHGLGGTMFGRPQIASLLAKDGTAVLAFNNRGHDRVSKLRPRGDRRKAILAGSVHEIFNQCEDDIQGTIDFVKRNGVKDVYLAGISTGCQKSVYWAYKKQSRGIKGIVLLAPISDYAATVHEMGAAKVARATAVARKLMRNVRRHALLPPEVWPSLTDAQRFLSLYSGTSSEELFPYWDKQRKPRALQSIRVPILMVLAGAEEHGKETPAQLARWFDANIWSPHRIVTVPHVGHNFKGGERTVAREIRSFLRETEK